MAQQTGRKKHMVEGDVKEITRSTTGLGTGKVGKGEGFLSTLLKSLTKQDKKNTSNGKRHF